MGYSIDSKGVGAVREESILPPRRSVEAFEVLDAQWCILLYLERYNVNEKRSPVGLNKIIGTMPLCPRSLRLCLYRLFRIYRRMSSTIALHVPPDVLMSLKV